jgi:coenzyme F420-reducing hydrogenase gamma subunit
MMQKVPLTKVLAKVSLALRPAACQLINKSEGITQTGTITCAVYCPKRASQITKAQLVTHSIPQKLGQ